MLEKTTVNYTCDHCEKKLVHKWGDETDFYDGGWVYLKGFIFAREKHTLEISDSGHFCSDECFLEYIKKAIKGEK